VSKHANRTSLKSGVKLIAILIILLQPRVVFADYYEEFTDYEEWTISSNCPVAYKGESCPPITFRLDTLFRPSLSFDSTAKIHSLFFATIMEIVKLPMYGRADPRHKNCKYITISESLFSLLNKKEQNTIKSIVGEITSSFSSSSLIISDIIFTPVKKVTNGISFDNLIVLDTLDFDAMLIRHKVFQKSTIACSIRTRIELDPYGEYILSLNGTSYRMVKLSDSHYALRAEKNKR
jgi:hypothetical protein